jgi:hypothetical protein
MLNGVLKVGKVILMADLEKLWVLVARLRASPKSCCFSSWARRNHLIIATLSGATLFRMSE